MSGAMRVASQRLPPAHRKNGSDFNALTRQRTAEGLGLKAFGKLMLRHSLRRAAPMHLGTGS
jgi:hypothetical protein